MDFTYTETDEKVIVGRRDYGAGVEALIVTVGDEVFAKYGNRFFSQCGDCDGGWSGSKRHFGHVLSGVCFQCNGRGYHRAYDSVDQIVRLAKRRVADRARRERKAAEKAAARDKARADWAAANPAVAAAADEVMADAPKMADGLPDYAANDAWIERWSDFVTSLANQAQFRPLSEKQTAAFLPAFEQAKAEHAAAVETASKQRYLDAAEGAKVTVPGVITVAATFEGTSYNGFPESQRIVIVEGSGDFEGVTVKMMGRAKALWDAERGQVVEVTGTVKGFSEYEGVPQTTLIRPKINVAAGADQ